MEIQAMLVDDLRCVVRGVRSPSSLLTKENVGWCFRAASLSQTFSNATVCDGFDLALSPWFCKLSPSYSSQA